MHQDPPTRRNSREGPYKPTLIIHGGAGAISRANLPPSLYQQYRQSLLLYLTDTKGLLDSRTSALDAACHAVSLMEDNPLFNCGRGSVFTRGGKIEMEASVMVASVQSASDHNYDGTHKKAWRPPGAIKRGAAVSLVRNTRHPILLAKEVLLDADSDDGLGGTSTMHCHLSGSSVERWGWKDRGLESKEDEWFWTKKRWEEHRRGLGKQKDGEQKYSSSNDGLADAESIMLPSQGTVGAVCLDSWGNVAVATSTGGLTNKAPGRIGDTPSIGAGFWAESWDEESHPNQNSLLDSSFTGVLARVLEDAVSEAVLNCLPVLRSRPIGSNNTLKQEDSFPMSQSASQLPAYRSPPPLAFRPRPSPFRRAVAISGTGNGDSFLRTNAVRTAAAICRGANHSISLSQAMTAIAGPGGELQRSAGNRWGRTGEGQGGIIGIEVERGCSEAKVVFDFNCGGLWRAYFEKDSETGKEVPTVMVFRDEY